MEIYILNSALEIVGVIDEVESKLWQKKYNDKGSCEIYAPCDETLLDLLRVGNYAYRYDDDMCCQFVDVQIKTDVEKGDYIIATGEDICRILSGRVIWETIDFEGRVCDFIKRIVVETVIKPSLVERRIANFVFDDSNFAEFPATIAYQTNREDALQLIVATCKAANYGFRVRYDIRGGRFVFSLYKGKNKATTASDPYVEFSPTYANILSTDYKYSVAGYRNVAMVVGKYVDDVLLYEVVGDTNGLARREIFVDATSISPTYKDENEVEHTYTEAEYRELMRDKGAEVLASNTATESFTGSVDIRSSYVYKTDYDLGDIVKVVNEYGIGAEARIVEVMESEDSDNGYDIEPKFEY